MLGSIWNAGDVVEPLPNWARAFVALVAAGVLAYVIVLSVDDGLGAPRPADWRLADQSLPASARHVPVIVHERQCASGRSADGRIEATVSYREESISIANGVRGVQGDVECQGNPDTPHVVELREPLDDQLQGLRVRVCAIEGVHDRRC